jgi:Flp pilus assembly protein CpaB
VSPEGSGARASAAIPADKVALAITANERVAVAGAVQPGDRVDVIMSWGGTNDERQITQDAIQDVRVFGVGRATGGVASGVLPTSSGAAAPTTVTLLVDYQEAVLVEHVLRTNGSISLVLRRFDQFGNVATQPITDPVARQVLEGQQRPAQSSGQ